MQQSGGGTMTRYEELLSEYEEVLDIEERSMICDGLYCDRIVWINKKLPEARRTCILAEEIGHYETSSGNILDLKDMNNARQELRARKWAYEKIIPFGDVLRAAQAGCQNTWEFAEHLNVDEEFMAACLRHYGIL